MTPIGMIRLKPSALTFAEQAKEIVRSGRFDHQSQHVALYVLSVRQSPDGVSLHDLVDGTGWGKSTVRAAMVQLMRDGFVESAMVACSYCGVWTCGETTHIDHVVARGLGGPDTPDNRVPCCRSCNSAKSAKPFLIWMLDVGGRYAA